MIASTGAEAPLNSVIERSAPSFTVAALAIDSPGRKLIAEAVVSIGAFAGITRRCPAPAGVGTVRLYATARAPGGTTVAPPMRAWATETVRISPTASGPAPPELTLESVVRAGSMGTNTVAGGAPTTTVVGVLAEPGPMTFTARSRTW